MNQTHGLGKLKKKSQKIKKMAFRLLWVKEPKSRLEHGLAKKKRYFYRSMRPNYYPVWDSTHVFLGKYVEISVPYCSQG